MSVCLCSPKLKFTYLVLPFLQPISSTSSNSYQTFTTSNIFAKKSTTFVRRAMQLLFKPFLF